jgi:hypothetical protein
MRKQTRDMAGAALLGAAFMAGGDSYMPSDNGPFR